MKSIFLKYHKYVVSIVLIVGILAPFVQSTIVFAASPWTQTDWSDGDDGDDLKVDPTDNPTTTYLSGSNITNAVDGEISETNIEQFTNAEIDSDLANWDNHLGENIYSNNLDVAGEIVTATDRDQFSFTNGGGDDAPFSVSAWVNRNSTGGGSGVIAKMGTSSGTYEWWLVIIYDQVYFYLYQTGPTGRIGRKSTATVVADGWHHLVVTYSGNNSASGIAIYKDGVRIDTTDDNYGSYAGQSNTTAPVTIGASNNGGTHAFLGKIAHPAIFNKELSQAEVTSLYTAKMSDLRTYNLNEFVANLVSAWSFPGGQNDHPTWTDYVSGYNGTMANQEATDINYDIPGGAGATVEHETSQTYSSSAGSVKIVTASTGSHLFTQEVDVGNTDTYDLTAYAYTSGATVSASDVELYANGATLSTIYTDMGSGWYKLSASTTGVDSSVEYGAQVKASKTVYLDSFSLKVDNYTSEKILTSNIFDTAQSSIWGTLDYTPHNDYAVAFDGTDDYISIPDADNLSFGTGVGGTDSPFSMSIWAYRNAATGWDWVMGKQTSQQEYSIVFLDGALRFMIFQNTGTNTYLAKSAVITTTGQWMNIVVTYDGNKNSAGLKIYRDGVELSTTNLSNNYYQGMSNTLASFEIGGTIEGPTAYGFNGKLDEAVLWSKALTQSEITEVYNNGMPSNIASHSAYSDVVSYWSLGDNLLDNTDTVTVGVSEAIRDEKNTNHGTPKNTASSAKTTSSAGTGGPTIKVRSSNSATMAGANDWSDCSAILSGANVSTGGCTTDNQRYIQYQADLSSASDLHFATLDAISISYELGAGFVVDVAPDISQRSTLAIPSVNQNIGGAFTIEKSGTAAAVTSISIDEMGTVGGADLQNATLYYKEQATCTDFIPSTAEVFGTASSFTGDTATFTGNITVDSDQVCLYVDFDIASTATAGETIELQITDPSTDVIVTEGETIAPATAVAITGTTTLGVASSESSDTIDVTTTDGCTIRFSNVAGTLTMTESGGGACPSGTYALTSDRVTVSDLAFTELTSADGNKKTIQIEMTLTDISTNEQKEFSFEQDFATSVTIR